MSIDSQFDIAKSPPYACASPFLQSFRLICDIDMFDIEMFDQFVANVKTCHDTGPDHIVTNIPCEGLRNHVSFCFFLSFCVFLIFLRFFEPRGGG